MASGPVGEILPASVILETKTFNEQIRSGNLNPFNRSEIVICSYQFARSKEPYIRLHERDPRIKADSETIRKSLEGNWRPEHLFTLARSRDLCRVYQQQIVNRDLEIEKMLPEFEPRVDPAERPLQPTGNEDVHAECKNGLRVQNSTCVPKPNTSEWM